MKVLAAPARRNRHRNPYNYLLSEALAAEGCDVVDLDDSNGLLSGWSVLHIHWPQEAARGRKRTALRKTRWLVTLLLVQRLRGARIVWTVHNIRGHDQNNPGLERLFIRFVTKIIHGAIFLSSSSREAACKAIPQLSSKTYTIVPHGLYGDRSDKTRAEARAHFALPSDIPVVGFLGDIKRYKGIDILLAAFDETLPGQACLFVAGTFPSPSYAEEIDARLAILAAKGHRIVFRDGRLDQPALVDAIRACNVVALVYREVANTGFALLALENCVPILTSNAAVFRDLQDEVGAEWVHVVEGHLTGEALIAAATFNPGNPSSRMEAFLNSRKWPRIGADTVAFYRRLGAR
jgi:beta-1,4-mannosyltransferase